MIRHGIENPDSSYIGDIVRKYENASHRLLKMRNEGRLELQLLSPIAGILVHNADFYTLWNWRRDILANAIENPANDFDPVFQLNSELDFLAKTISSHPKIYALWSHREWVVRKLLDLLDEASVLDKELQFVDKQLMLDNRNFHAWNYRQLFLRNVLPDDENDLRFLRTLVRQCVTNHSAWHHLIVVLQRVPDKSIACECVQLLIRAIELEPGNESLWAALRALFRLDATLSEAIVDESCVLDVYSRVANITLQNDCCTATGDQFIQGFGGPWALITALSLISHARTRNYNSSNLESATSTREEDWPKNGRYSYELVKQIYSYMDTQFEIWPDSLTIEPQKMREEERALLEALGSESVSRGRVAVLIMAGGDGSRLGCNGPKGCYELNGETLFDIIFRRIDSDFTLAQQLSGFKHKSIESPLVYVMCSPTNRAATEEYMKESPYLKSRKSPLRLRLLTQGTLPILSEDKATALAPGLVSPSGNGAIYECLHKEHVIEELGTHGVTYLAVCTVDNVLSHPLNLMSVGAALSHDAEVVNKICCRRNGECVGVQVVSHVPVDTTDDVLPTEHRTVVDAKGGYAAVCEYFELPSALSDQVDTSGVPLYWHANLGMHLLSYAFLKRIADEHLWSMMPLHYAHRPVTYTNSEGHRVSPQTHPFTGQLVPNAYKQERFIFDAFRFAPLKRCVCYLVDRESDFCPLKDSSCVEVVTDAMRRHPVK